MLLFPAAMVAALSGCADMPSRSVAQRQSGFKYIRPLLDCPGTSGMKEIRPFVRELTATADAATKSKKVEQLAVYYRDLNNGPLATINEDLKFTPASLLKVPLAIAYLKYAETNPAVLDEQYLYDPSLGDENQDVLFPPTHAIEKGRSYSVNELLVYMLRFSDNNAKNVLHAHVKPEILGIVLADLGITLPPNAPDDSVTVLEYSTIFRLLYNATYLRRDLSEKLLHLLSESDFLPGLRAGTPSAVEVAHKFGERHDERSKQIHDCGIVYHPQRPYLLCILARGEDVGLLTATIMNISRMVYEEANEMTGSPN